jgi:hypothetical protein
MFSGYFKIFSGHPKPPSNIQDSSNIYLCNNCKILKSSFNIIILMLIFCQCANNGINYSKIQNGEKCNVDKLEMFFSGFPKIVEWDIKISRINEKLSDVKIL